MVYWCISPVEDFQTKKPFWLLGSPKKFLLPTDSSIFCVPCMGIPRSSREKIVKRRTKEKWRKSTDFIERFYILLFSLFVCETEGLCHVSRRSLPFSFFSLPIHPRPIFLNGSPPPPPPFSIPPCLAVSLRSAHSACARGTVQKGTFTKGWPRDTA